jgi:hypothetical protein
LGLDRLIEGMNERHQILFGDDNKNGKSNSNNNNNGSGNGNGNGQYRDPSTALLTKCREQLRSG